MAVGLYLGTALSTLAEEFRNLAFDDGDVSSLAPPDSGQLFGPVEGLLPGWTVLDARSGSVPLTVIRYNTFPGGLGFEGIAGDGGDFPYQGRFSFVAGAAAYSSTNGVVDVYPISISQKNVVPLDAKTLRYVVYNDPWEVQVNGTYVSVKYDIHDPGAAPDGGGSAAFPTRFAYVDISPWAGQEVDLVLTTTRLSGLDSIEFLNTAVIPEPGTFALVLMGFGLPLFLRFRRLAGRVMDAEPPSTAVQASESSAGLRLWEIRPCEHWCRILPKTFPSTALD